MSWSIYHCSKCGKYHSSEIGTVCPICKIKMAETKYLDDNFPQLNKAESDNTLVNEYLKQLGNVSKEQLQEILQDKNGYYSEEAKYAAKQTLINRNQYDYENDVNSILKTKDEDISESKDIIINEYQLYQDVHRLAKDVRFMSNVLRIYIIITCILFFLGFLWYLVAVAWAL